MVDLEHRKDEDMDTKDTVESEQMFAAVAQHLMKQYNLTANQVTQMVHLSIQTLKGSLAVADQACQDGDIGELADAAHKIKGVLLSLGLDRQVEMARGIEVSGKAGRKVDYPAMIAELQESVYPLISSEIDNSQ